MNQIYSKTPGEAWLRTCKLVIEKGKEIKDEGLVLKEIVNLFISVENPSIEDKILVKYGDRDEKEWMRRLWFETEPIPAMGRFPNFEVSYGKRLFDIDGKNHKEWVINKLRKNPDTKSATISTLFPGEEQKTNISCVTTLDFKIRNGKLACTAFVRSQDAYKKLQWDILFLGQLTEKIAKEVSIPVGQLNSFIVSEHIYSTDFNEVMGLLKKIIR